MRTFDLSEYTELVPPFPSSKFRKIWYTETPDPSIAIEFHNFKNRQGRGAIYTYEVSDEVLENVVSYINSCSEMDDPISLGSFIHKTLIAKDAGIPYALVQDAE